jgi:hypothetical protein
MKEMAANNSLRTMDKNGKLLCSVPINYTLKDAELKMRIPYGLS